MRLRRQHAEEGSPGSSARMKLRLVFVLGSLALLFVASSPVLAAGPALCSDTHVQAAGMPVLDANPCTQGIAYACHPVNKQGDWRCEEVWLWCWCPGPVLA